MSSDEIRLCAIMHAEIASPDSLLSRGKDEALSAFAQFRETIRAATQSKGGRVLESSRGEAIASFDTSSSAIQAAVDIQKALSGSIKVKIGINVGDVLFAEDGAIGSTADIAEELVRAVPSGGICVSAAALHASPSIRKGAASVVLEMPSGEKIEAFKLDDSAEQTSPKAGAAPSSVPEQKEAQSQRAATAAHDGSRQRQAQINGSDPHAAFQNAPNSIPSFETLKRQIFDEIKRTGRRPSSDEAWAYLGKYGQSAWDVISSLSEAGILRDSRSRGSYRADEVAERVREKINRKLSNTLSSGFATYRAELRKTADRLRHSIAPSIISYLGFNAALYYVNVTYASQVPWAVPISALWLFGLLRRFFRAGQSSRIAREAEGIANLNANQLKEYKAINKERGKFLSRFFSFFSVSTILLFINLFSDKKTPWFIIPSAVMAVSLITHSIDYKARMPKRIRQFFDSIGPTSQGASGGTAGNVNYASLGPYADAYAQAAKDADSFLSTFKKMSPNDMPEAEKTVKAGMDQILLLASTLNELDGLIASMPLKELEKDRANIEVKKRDASPTLSAEYDTSLAEIDAQFKGHKSLLERKESLEIKLRSMSTQFRQLSLDLASAHAADAQSKLKGQHAALENLSKKAEEIRVSIEDMRAGSDDWLSAEIEKLSQGKLIEDKA